MSEVMPSVTGWTLARWQRAYRDPSVTPRQLLDQVMRSQREDDPAWIERLTPQRLESALAALQRRLDEAGGDRTKLPLFGVPFAAKDNIDAAGWTTTAACPAFAYEAVQDAALIARLRAAGAVLVGKTNLDQFATGLVGTRSPYGKVPNTFDPRYISGGSSSGSASVVARGLVPFALGTDTAGSGRVPAGLNNIVGLKPTRGWFSTRGLVPACRTLDCISIFALTVADAASVADVAGAYDEADPYSRPWSPEAPANWTGRLRLAVPAEPEFFGDAQARTAWLDALDRWRALGATIEPVDFTAFAELAALLYAGPWVAERYIAAAATLERDPGALDPVVRSIVEGAARYSAADTFRAEYRRAQLARTIQQMLAGFDAMLVPTAPTAYTFEQIAADPVLNNTRLGTYTNFTNLADLSALALPAGFRGDGLPVGVTLIGRAWHDRLLAAIGRRWQQRLALPLGATGQSLPIEDAVDAADTAPGGAALEPDHLLRIAVVGAHLSGMPLNHQLTSRGARLVQACRTASRYRLFALANTQPPKPGLVRVSEPSQGAPIDIELWDLPAAALAAFVGEIAPPLGIGTLELADGRLVKGFICEPFAVAGARDITAFGGWRAFIAQASGD